MVSPNFLLATLAINCGQCGGMAYRFECSLLIWVGQDLVKDTMICVWIKSVFRLSVGFPVTSTLKSSITTSMMVRALVI